RRRVASLIVRARRAMTRRLRPARGPGDLARPAPGPDRRPEEELNQPNRSPPPMIAAVDPRVVEATAIGGRWGGSPRGRGWPDGPVRRAPPRRPRRPTGVPVGVGRAQSGRARSRQARAPGRYWRLERPGGVAGRLARDGVGPAPPGTRR